VADALDLLTPDEAKRAINKALVADDQNDVLARHVTAVSRLVDDHCGPVVQREITAEVHYDVGCSVFLRQWPVAEITLVREANGGTPVTLTAIAFGESGDGYYAPSALEPDLLAGVLYRWSSGIECPWRGAVEVTYTAGRYEDTESVDARFKDAAGAILRRLWKREAGAWSKGPEFWENLDDQVGVGFFRVAQPIIDEMLWADRHPPAVA
jgi:hypothetical protein